MATLQKIRSKGPLVAIVIGLALLAFVLGDAVRSSGRLFSQSQRQIAEIGGESISIDEYQKEIKETSGIYNILQGDQNNQSREQMRERVWNQMVRKNVMDGQYAELGIGVSSQELFQLVQGENPAPIIKRLFTNRKTGEFNSQNVINFVRNLEYDESGKNKQLWLYIEDQISRNRKFEKYTSLVSQGLYVTSLSAKKDMQAKKRSFGFDYLGKEVSSVSDDAVNITDKKLKAYYKKHKKNFEQEEARNIEYVSFEATPTSADTAKHKNWINDIYSDFEKTDKEGQFAKINSDEEFDPTYHNIGTIEDSVLNKFAFNGSEGDMYGPYKKEGSYRITKIADITQLADSLKAQQIVLTPQQRSRRAMQQLRSRADSIKEQIQAGADFGELARQNSSGQNASQGGDMGWINRSEIDKTLRDSLFFAEEGEITEIRAQQAIRIMRVSEKSPEKKTVQLATIVRNITPSEGTLDNTFRKANSFAAENSSYSEFSNAINNQGLTKRIANNLKPMDKEIQGIDEEAREVIKWAYDAEKGNVSSVFEIGDQFVVASLTAIKEKGIAPLEQVRSHVVNQVRQEEKKNILAERFKEETANKNNLFDIANSIGTTVQNATNVTLDSRQIEGLGYEPKVLGAASALKEGQISSPIKGDNGVYLVKTNSITEPPESANYFVNQNSLNQQYSRRIRTQLYNSLKEAVEVVDKRAKFY